MLDLGKAAFTSRKFPFFLWGVKMPQDTVEYEIVDYGREDPPPPLVDVVYFPHKKCKQMHSGKWLEWFRQYVQKKLLVSGVIPEYEANPVNPDSLATHIIHEACRQPDVDFLDGRGMASINWAYYLIRQAIKFPPSPVSAKYFSLRAYTYSK